MEKIKPRTWRRTCVCFSTKQVSRRSSLRCQVGLCANSRLGGEPCVTATSCLLSVQCLGLYALSLGSNALQARATLRYFCLIKRCRCFWVVCAHTKRSWPLIFGMQRYTESKALFFYISIDCDKLPSLLLLAKCTGSLHGGYRGC